MPGDTDEFRVPITADVSELLAGFQEASDKAEEMGEKMHAAGEEGHEGMEHMGEGAEEAGEKMGELKEKLDEHTESVGKALQGWTGLMGVIGAGAAAEVLEKVAEVTMELGDSLRQTSEALNVSASDARGFNEAMSSLGVSSSAAMMSIRKMQMDVEHGGKTLQQLGISMEEVKTKFSDGISLFEEVIDRLSKMEPGVQRNGLAFSLLGRNASQILGVLDQVNNSIDRHIEEAREDNDQTIASMELSQRFHEVLTDLNKVWEDLAVRVGPEVLATLQAIDNIVRVEIQGWSNYASVIKTAVEALQQWANTKVSPQTQALLDRAKQLEIEGPQVGDAAQGGTMGSQVSSVSNAIQQGWETVWARQKEAAKEAADAYCSEIDRQANQGKIPVPDPIKGGKKKGGSSDPMAGLDNALDSADHKMVDLQHKFQMLGSEAEMAGKEGAASFDELRAKAVADYEKMLQKSKEFTDAVNSGNKQAAQSADHAWHEAAADFEKDWQKAEQKAKQDMQQIKSEADSIASDVSGILNSAISGKLNWAQEFDKILSKMLSSLIKHLAEQIGLWASHEAQVNTVKATGGATGLALQKSQDNQAGQSSAVTAAKGAYASASQIPYIGWILGPIAAATAFAGVEAFGSAEGGFDIPPGLSPITQLHTREMVLPANLADNVRNVTSGGGTAGGSLSQNFNIQAWDGQSVIETLLGNPGAIAGATQMALRSGVMINGHG